MSKNIPSTSIATSVLWATALMIGASPAMAQRPGAGQGDAQRPPQEAPPPPARPQNPPPAPTREQNARTEKQREENARAQQEQQRIEKARQEQTAKDQERIARARQEAAPTDPKYRDTVGRLIGAERVHREQLARINRLKQIAVRQGQDERVAELDRLLVGSNSNFEHKLQSAKTELPEGEYNNAVKMLEQGRRREVKQMMGQDADPTRVQRAPPGGAVQAPKRVPAPERPKQDPNQPPH